MDENNRDLSNISLSDSIGAYSNSNCKSKKGGLIPSAIIFGKVQNQISHHSVASSSFLAKYDITTDCRNNVLSSFSHTRLERIAI